MTIVASATMAAGRFTPSHSIRRPVAESAVATVRPSTGVMRPSATGRSRVRFMSRSVSRSLTWLYAAAPLATSAVPRQVTASAPGSIGPCDAM
jgi:hypothetical protein